jgi:hypothetical protein
VPSTNEGNDDGLIQKEVISELKPFLKIVSVVLK